MVYSASHVATAVYRHNRQCHDSFLAKNCEVFKIGGDSTRGGPKFTGILGGKVYKEKNLDIAQDFNAR